MWHRYCNSYKFSLFYPLGQPNMSDQLRGSVLRRLTWSRKCLFLDERRVSVSSDRARYLSWKNWAEPFLGWIIQSLHRFVIGKTVRLWFYCYFPIKSICSVQDCYYYKRTLYLRILREKHALLLEVSFKKCRTFS